MNTTAALKIQKPGTDKLLPGLHFQTLETSLSNLLERGALPLSGRPSTESENLTPVPAIAFEPSAEFPENNCLPLGGRKTTTGGRRFD